MSETISLETQQVKAEWLETVQAFCDEVSGWSLARGWQVSRRPVEIVEEMLGAYEVPSLTVRTETGAVVLEPVARMVMGAAGRIDLYAYPSLFRVMLLRVGDRGEWYVRTDSGIRLREPWNEETFASLVEDLIAAG